VNQPRLTEAAAAAVARAWLEILRQRHPEVHWTLISVDEPDCTPSGALVSEEMNAGGPSD
jgi:hypothetical protein